MSNEIPPRVTALQQPPVAYTQSDNIFINDRPIMKSLVTRITEKEQNAKENN